MDQSINQSEQAPSVDPLYASVPASTCLEITNAVLQNCFFKKIGTTSGGQLNTPSDYEFQHLHNQLFVNAGTTSSGVANI